MSRRSETIVLALWASALCSLAAGVVVEIATGDAWAITRYAVIGCFLLLNALLVAVLNGRG